MKLYAATTEYEMILPQTIRTTEAACVEATREMFNDRRAGE